MPKTRTWKQVVQLLGSDSSDVSSIAKATAKSAQKAFSALNTDIGIQLGFWLLTQLTLKSKDKDFIQKLRDTGIEVSANVDNQYSFIAEISQYLKKEIKSSGRDNLFSEIARLSLVSILNTLFSRQTPGLFGSSIDDFKDVLKESSKKKNFASLSRDYFAEILSRSMNYFLSKETYNHISGDLKFKNINDNIDFDNAVKQYCSQTAKIVEEFSGGWYTKTEYEKGIGRKEAEGFVYHAMNKICKELGLEVEEDSAK